MKIILLLSASVFLVAAAAVFVACGNGDDSATATSTPTASPSYSLSEIQSLAASRFRHCSTRDGRRGGEFYPWYIGDGEWRVNGFVLADVAGDIAEIAVLYREATSEWVLLGSSPGPLGC